MKISIARYVVGFIQRALLGLLDFTKDVIRPLLVILKFLFPFAMLAFGEYIYSTRGYFSIGSEWLVPVAYGAVIYLLNDVNNVTGKGTTIPVPKDRFTDVSSDGEVSVPNSRVQEMILYMADVEDWLERKRML